MKHALPIDIEVAPRRGVLAWLIEKAFAPVRLSDEAVEKLTAAARLGPIVFVAKSESQLGSLLLGVLLRRANLPWLRYVAHLPILLWQPLGVLWRFYKSKGLPLPASLATRRSEACELAWQQQVMAQNDASLLFLLRPRTATAGALMIGEEALRRMLAARQGRRVSVVPLSLFYENAPETRRRTPFDFIFGTRSEPGRLRELELFLLNRTDARVEVGEPIVIDGPVDTDQLRQDVLSVLQQHSRLVRGPRLAARRQTINAVLHDPELLSALDEQGKLTGETRSSLVRVAEKLVDEIAADYQERVVMWLRSLLDWVFTRIYDGVVVDEEGFVHIKEALMRGTLVITPSHKSHADYLILSYLFAKRGLKVPHIAAGINLSFWPMGTIFRSSGAFFVRRSFKNNPVYGAAFRAYVKRLIHDRFTLEFFPEGGRSRTGRLLPAKLGMFKYVVEAWGTPGSPEVTVLPVSVEYEKIIEQASYTAELQGGKKRSEDLRGLLNTRRVLRSRYGRVHVRFGEPLVLSEVAHSRGIQRPTLQTSKLSDADVVTLSRSLGFQVMHDIGRTATVTPSALIASVLLNHRQRGIRREMVHASATRLMDELRWLHAPLSESLGSNENVVNEALNRFRDERRVRIETAQREPEIQVVDVPEEQRIALSYYQNTLTNHLVAHAIVATAVLVEPGAFVSDVERRARLLSRMLKHEFSFRTDRPFEKVFGAALSELVAHGMVHMLQGVDSEPTVVGEEARLCELYGFLEATIGAYVAALFAVEELKKFPLSDKELVDRGLDQAKLWVLEGTLRTPESLQRPLLQNAISWLRDLEIVAGDPKGALSLGKAVEDAQALVELRRFYGRFLYIGVPRTVFADSPILPAGAHTQQAPVRPESAGESLNDHRRKDAN